jgi:hypothetical protein
LCDSQSRFVQPSIDASPDGARNTTNRPRATAFDLKHHHRDRLFTQHRTRHTIAVARQLSPQRDRIYKIIKLEVDKENRAPRGMTATMKKRGNTPGRPKKTDNQFWDIGKVGRYAITGEGIQVAAEILIH